MKANAHLQDRGPVGVPSEQPGSPVIELQGISKRFGNVQALQEVSFSVLPGEVVALLGPNGAGKTTTISIILGLRQPTVGQVRLFGHPPRSQEARSRCGIMLQESGVPMNLTVRELINLFRSYYPKPLPTEQVIGIAGLEGKAHTRGGTLSGGQRQRLYFALAVCGDPALLLMDEPTRGLDVEARQEFWAEIRSFVQAGKTILLTTHYLEEVDALADRVVLLAEGRVIANASPAALKAHIALKRVRFDVATPLHAHDFAQLRVQHLELTPHHVAFLSAEPELVLRALFSQDLQIRNLEVGGASLEEAVLLLSHTKGE